MNDKKRNFIGELTRGIDHRNKIECSIFLTSIQ